MKTNIKTIALVAIAAIAASCETAKLQEEVIPAEGMYAVISNPVQGELAATKALSTEMAFSFSPSDKIDVFAGEEGEQMIYKITVSESDTRRCSYKVGSFGLLDGTYYTLYPTQGAVDDYTAVPVSFLGQIQNGNNNSDHLAAYDFNTSNAEVVSNNATFEYDHCVCWFPLDLTFPVATTVKSVSICTPSAAIPTAAKINVQTGAITTTSTADELTVTFAEPINVEANGVVTVFLTTAPFTIPGELAINANCETEGQTKVYSAAVSTSATTQAGVFYRLAKTLVDPDDQSVAIVAGVKYDVLAEAIAAAEDGQTVEITKADTYKLPGITKNITIQAAVNGVVFDCVGAAYSSIASIPNGCTFENVQFELGTTSYHGFQHAGTIDMYGCTINGLLFSYGVMNFNGCTFNQSASDYCMWNYGTDNTYTGCTFNTNGKCLNVYCESNSIVYNITLEGCTFNSTKLNKAAVNVKETCGSTMLKYNVVIKDCTIGTPDFYPAPSADATGILYVIDPLVQVDDRNLSATKSDITVTLNDEVVYPIAMTSVAKVGDTEYTTLNDAVRAALAANDGTPVVLTSDITYSEDADFTPVVYNGGTVVIDGDGHTVKGLPGMLLKKEGSGGHHLSVSNITFDGAQISEDGYAAVIVGYADAMNELYFENVTIKNSSVTGTNYAAAFVGYAAGYNVVSDGPVFQQVTFKNCTVENSIITGGGSTGALMGHAAGNAWGKVTVEGTAVRNNKITCTGSSTNKAGSLFGTVGAAGLGTGPDGADAGLFVSANVSGNTVKSGSATITTICGRQGSTGGTLVMTSGGSYDARPFNESDAWASCATGYELSEVGGVWTVNEKEGDAEDAILVATQEELLSAIKDAENGATIKLSTGTYTTYNTSDLKGKTLTFVGDGEVTWKYGKDSAVSGEGGSDYSCEGSDVTFKNVIFVDNFAVNSYYRGFVRAASMTFESCTFKNMMGYWGIGDVHFTDCIFDAASVCEYDLKLYSGKDFYFDGCTFYGNNKGYIQAYMQDASETIHKVYVKDCKFEAKAATSKTAVYFYDQGAAEGARWEIHFDGSNVNVNNSIANSSVSGTWLWGDMKYQTSATAKIYEGSKLVWENNTKIN